MEGWGAFCVTLPGTLQTLGVLQVLPCLDSPALRKQSHGCPVSLPGALMVPGHVLAWVDKMARPVLMALDASALWGGWVVRRHTGQEEWHDVGREVRQALEPC